MHRVSVTVKSQCKKVTCEGQADSVIKEKLLESEVLAKQATSNTKEQFAGSPDLGAEVEGAIIDALDAHTTMSTQALESKQVQREIIKILLDHSSLYEDLRARASSSPH